MGENHIAQCPRLLVKFFAQNVVVCPSEKVFHQSSVFPRQPNINKLSNPGNSSRTSVGNFVNCFQCGRFAVNAPIEANQYAAIGHFLPRTSFHAIHTGAFFPLRKARSEAHHTPMKPALLAGKISSLATALSVFLSAHSRGTEGITATLPKIESPDSDGTPGPVLLKAPQPREMSELQFAGHRSHSSHSSHSSHRSGSSGGGYVPTYSTPAPTYVPRAVSTPTYYPQPTPRVATPIPTPTPTPQPTPTPEATPTPLVSIEFKNGAIFYGRVIVKSPAGITFQTDSTKIHKIPASLLSDKTVRELALGPTLPTR